MPYSKRNHRKSYRQPKTRYGGKTTSLDEMEKIFQILQTQSNENSVYYFLALLGFI